AFADPGAAGDIGKGRDGGRFPGEFFVFGEIHGVRLGSELCLARFGVPIQSGAAKFGTHRIHAKMTPALPVCWAKLPTIARLANQGTDRPLNFARPRNTDFLRLALPVRLLRACTRTP